MLGDALLAPTQIYVKAVLELLRAHRIDGLAHITGGGLTENIVRVLPGKLGISISTSAWERPEVFNWIQENGAIEESEMLRTFNCGIGMVMLVPANAAGAVISHSRELGIACFDIGEVTAGGSESRVCYQS
jgi:phosphoribosylformylglycinamidine cyclo-ligase